MKSYSETRRDGNLNEFDFKKKVSGLINETVNEFNNRYLEMNKNLMKFKNDFLNKMNYIQEIIDNNNSNYYQIKTEDNINNNKNMKNKIKKKNNNILKNLSFGINSSFNVYSSTNSTTKSNNNNNNNNNVIYNNKKYNNLVNKPFDTKYNKNSIKYNFIKNINNSIEKHLKNQSKKKNVSFINYNYYNNHKNNKKNNTNNYKKKYNNYNNSNNFNIHNFSNFSNKNDKKKRPHSLNKININNKNIKEFLLSSESSKIDLKSNKIKALEILCNKTNFLTKNEKIKIKFLNKELYKNIILNDDENNNNNNKINLKFPSKTCQIGINFLNKKKEEIIFNDQSEISKNVIKIIYYLFNIQNKFNINNNSKDLYEFIYNFNNVKNIRDLFFNVIYDKIYNKCEISDENINEFRKEISQNKEILNLIIQTNNSPLCWIVMNLLEIDEYLELIILNN